VKKEGKMKITKVFLIGAERVVNEIPYTPQSIVFRMDKGYYLAIDLLQHGKFTVNAAINKYEAHAGGEGLENLLEKLRENEND
jgi:hypothetical protein